MIQFLSMTKYSKMWQNGRKKVDEKVIPWIAASKSSDQKFCSTSKVDPKISTLRGIKAVTNISVEIKSLQKRS